MARLRRLVAGEVYTSKDWGVFRSCINTAISGMDDRHQPLNVSIQEFRFSTYAPSQQLLIRLLCSAVYAICRSSAHTSFTPANVLDNDASLATAACNRDSACAAAAAAVAFGAEAAAPG